MLLAITTGLPRSVSWVVRYYNAVVFFELSFFFLHRNARPVSYELIRAGESVEQCGFTAVGVTRKSNTQIHFDSLSFFKVI